MENCQMCSKPSETLRPVSSHGFTFWVCGDKCATAIRKENAGYRARGYESEARRYQRAADACRRTKRES